MEDNEDEPDDVKQATPVEEEITKGEIDEHSSKPTTSIEPARRQHNCQKDRTKISKKSVNNKEECCRQKLAKAARAPKTQKVLVYDKECTLPKIKCIPRHCLSKEEWIDVLATPKRRCPPPCFQREVTRKIRPVSTRIAELARPPKSRLFNTLQDRAGTLPIEQIDNLIQTLEGETCLTPEQAERMFRDKDIRARKKCRKRTSKLNCKESKSSKHEEPKIVPNASLFDKEAVCCQYMMAESFVKSILEWKTPIPREEFKDIAEVILKRLGHVLEYNPVNSEDRKSQQMRFLADVVASWISGVLFDVAEVQKAELEEECEKKRQGMDEESEEDSDDESEEEPDEGDDDDDDDGGKDKKKKKDKEEKPPKKKKGDKDRKRRGDGKDDEEDDDDDKKGGTPGQQKQGQIGAGDIEGAEDTSKKDGNVEVDESAPGTQDLIPEVEEEPQEMEGTIREEDGIVGAGESELTSDEVKIDGTGEPELTSDEAKIDGTGEPELTSDEAQTSEKKPEEMEAESKQKADNSKDVTENESNAGIIDENAIPDKIDENLDPDSSPGGVQIVQAEDDKVLETSDEAMQDTVDEPSTFEETAETPAKTSETDDKILSEESPIDEETKKLETDDQMATIQVSEIQEPKEKEVVEVDAEDVDKEVIKDESSLEDSERILDEVTGTKKTSQTFRKPSKIPSRVSSTRVKKFQTDTPFVTFDKIFHTIYNAIETSHENPGQDPITNRIHRAVYEKCSNIVQEEKPQPLGELTKDVLDVLSGKIALWLRDILSESDLAFINKFPATVESGDVREWTKWIGYVSDTANTWSAWIQQTIRQADAMRSGKVTRGDWVDWTKSVGQDALLWRRFYVESLHQAHQNHMMIRDRQVVKTGTRNIPGDEYEREMKITDLETER